MDKKKINYTFAGGPTMAPDVLKDSMFNAMFDGESSILNINSNHKECEQMKAKVR